MPISFYTNKKALGQLIGSRNIPESKSLTNMGVEIGKLYTDMGFPPDMALSRLGSLTNEQKLCVLDGVCQWLVKHKRMSGATEKAVDRQRSANRKMVESFVLTGEVGVY